jgi:hypothetical protein
LTLFPTQKNAALILFLSSISRIISVASGVGPSSKVSSIFPLEVFHLKLPNVFFSIKGGLYKYFKLCFV